MTGPLEGLRVVDLSRLLPGGYATSLLADLGADVLKVEQVGVGDGLRAAPPYDDSGAGAAHRALNRGKRSMTVDLKHPAGLAIVLDLVERADVLVDSFRPGVMQRLGLGRDVLQGANPRLVHVAITFYGHDSPRAEAAGHDLNAQALAGLLTLAEGPAGGPARPYLQAADHAVGLQAALAAVAALRGRDRTGRGAFCDVSMTDAAYSLLGLAAAAYSVSGEVPSSHEMLTGGLACYGTYVCADGRHLAVGALEPVFFGRLLEALGLPSSLAELQYDPGAQQDLRRTLAEVLVAEPRAEWVHRLAGVDCCVTPVHDLGEAFDDDAARARGLVVGSPGAARAVVAPIPRVEGIDGPAVASRPAPALGAHTAAVLAELGRGPSEFDALRAEGVV